MTYKINHLLIFTLFMQFNAIANEEDLLNNIYYDGIVISETKREYSLDVNDLFTKSIKNSYKVNAQIYSIKSEQLLYSASNYYYIPTATITSEVQKKFDRPGHKSPFTEFKLDLVASIKLWSNATGELKDSAFYSLLASKETYNDIVNSIYTTVNQNIIKIELAKAFLSKSEKYRLRLNALMDRMDISSQSGILKKSDKLFADVSIKKFEESILNVKSQIENYKSQINNITPVDLYNSEYGVSQEYIENTIALDDNMFKINKVIERNFSVLSKRAQLESDKNAAKAYNENFIVEVVTQLDIKESAFSNIKNDKNEVINGYTFDDDGQSYVGLKMTFSGLNYQSLQQKESEYNLFSRKLIEIDEFIHQLYVDLNTFKQQHLLIEKRLENVENQIDLTIGVINSLMKEMLVDESNVLDIFRNISSLSDLEMNRITIQNELVDITTKVKSINSIIPSAYVIN